VIGMPLGTDGFPWWNDTVFYQVFVRSFYDSNGDGKGDLPGLIAKLDYLNDGNPNTTDDLGVTGLWLMPIQPSPTYHGYDVTDYYAVNPDYGTPEDFKRLMEEAHQRGVRVIIDLVLNHTSSQHPWFQEAKDPGSERRNWYIWTEHHPGYKGPWGQDVWHVATTGDYYYAVFWSGMPDLNYTEPAVVGQMQDVARFWLEEMGADGFRLDGAKHIVEEEQVQENTPGTHAWWEGFRTFYKGVKADTLTVGEVWSSNSEVNKYLEGDELDLAFNFDLAAVFVRNAGYGAAREIERTLDSSTRSFPHNGFATFLTNHDQNRSMSVLGNDVDKAKAAASLLLTSPGVPFLYYGEEIGMLGQKPDEDIRKPMQWSGEANAGFSTARPWRAPEEDFTTKSVASQSADERSLLSHYRSLIRLRNQHAALRVGEYVPVTTGNNAVLAFLRASRQETVLVVINLSKKPVSEYALVLESGPFAGEVRALPLLGEGRFTGPQINAGGGFNGYRPVAELPAAAILLLQLQTQK
jgi:glycosidase